MKRIGLLTCTNTTQDLACSSFGCFNDFNNGTGKFTRYSDEGAVLIGIINCAGCPTLLTPEKILNRVRTLVASRVDAIHISNCVLALCPFKRSYIKILRENFPDIEIVEGTHAHDPKLEKLFCNAVVDMAKQPQQTMANFHGAALKKGRIGFLMSTCLFN